MSHVHAFFMHTYHFFFNLSDIKCVGTFLFVPLSLFLSVSCSMTPKCKPTLSRNPLHSRASSSSPSADPTPVHVRFRDDKARKDFLEKSFYRIFSILTFPLSSTVGVGSHYVAPQSCAIL